MEIHIVCTEKKTPRSFGTCRSLGCGAQNSVRFSRCYTDGSVASVNYVCQRRKNDEIYFNKYATENRSFATRVTQLKIWYFWVIGIERNVCRCNFNRYSVIMRVCKTCRWRLRYIDYNFACCFVWVWNLVADIAGGKEAEGVWEHGVEENIWT